MSAPITPSQVLPGLICGASLWRPKRRPAKYAAVSAIQTTSRTHQQQSRGDFCSGTTASHAGTRTIQPATPSSSGCVTRHLKYSQTGAAIAQNTSASRYSAGRNDSRSSAGQAPACASTISTGRWPATRTTNSDRAAAAVMPASLAHSIAPSAGGQQEHQQRPARDWAAGTSPPSSSSTRTTAVSTRCLSIDAGPRSGAFAPPDDQRIRHRTHARVGRSRLDARAVRWCGRSGVPDRGRNQSRDPAIVASKSGHSSSVK